MRTITLELTEAEHELLQRCAERHRRRVNTFYAARDMPQLGEYPIERYAAARLKVALDQDEELSRATGGGAFEWPA